MKRKGFVKANVRKNEVAPLSLKPYPSQGLAGYPIRLRSADAALANQEREMKQLLGYDAFKSIHVVFSDLIKRKVLSQRFLFVLHLVEVFRCAVEHLPESADNVFS